MSILQKLIGSALRPVVRRQARGLGFTEARELLSTSRLRVEPRFRAARDTPANREAMNHIIGIERWSQSRLRVALGAPFVLDGYRGHRLPEGAELDRLQEGFTVTRDETIAIVDELVRNGVDPSFTVRHNDFGELTLVEWLVYLDGHGRREMIRIRPG